MESEERGARSEECRYARQSRAFVVGVSFRLLIPHSSLFIVHCSLFVRLYQIRYNTPMIDNAYYIGLLRKELSPILIPFTKASPLARMESL